jgi:predicted dehydrogenase
MSRYATGKANDLDLMIHGEKGALKIWSNTNESKLEVCLGPDIETQTWRPLDCQPTPRNEERFLIALLSGINGDPSFRRAADVQKLLDLAFQSDAEGRLIAVA